MTRTNTILLACILSCLLFFLPKTLWAETTDAGEAMAAVAETTTAAEPAAETTATAKPVEKSVTEKPMVSEPITAPESTESVANSDKTITAETAKGPNASENPASIDAASQSDQPNLPVSEKTFEEGEETAPASDPSDKDSFEAGDDTEEAPPGPVVSDEDGESEAAGEAPVVTKKDTDSSVEEPADVAATSEGEKLATGRLSTKALETVPMLFGAATLENARQDETVYVTSFQQLKEAIGTASTEGTVRKIVMTKSFELTETLTIGKGKNIILTAENDVPKDNRDWTVENPADYADAGEERQREVIEESRQKGEEALAYTDLKKNPLPKETNEDDTPTNNIILKRADDFLGILIKVISGGKLTIGEENTALYVDGNGENVTTKLSDGFMIDISGQGSELHLDNGVLMNSKNGIGYSAPVKVHKGASFDMSGGRISNNENAGGSGSRPTSAGGVYVLPGGRLTMTGGSIDNNAGGTGGVFIGDLSGSQNAQLASFDMTGGIIARNEGYGALAMGGGVNVYTKSTFNAHSL